MNETEAVNEQFTHFLEEFKDLDKYLEALLKGKSLQSVSDQISLADNAKLNTALAYLVNSLYYIYMKTNGISFENHKINDEMELIKKYVMKVQEVILVQEDQRKNPMMVDQAAAERMIRAHLGDSLNQGMDIETADTKDSKAKQNDNAYELEEWEIAELQKKEPVKKSQKLHKGSLMPSDARIGWKDQIEKMLK
mmetsp:Transcript_34987/g.40913  ORF Transcript_34987/g.40913 Transcript_34987/m.40913 type:complete len:194 (+) Transcript_34987:6-587(+)